MNDGRSGHSRVVLGVFACPLGERRGSNGGRLCLTRMEGKERESSEKRLYQPAAGVVDG